MLSLGRKRGLFREKGRMGEEKEGETGRGGGEERSMGVKVTSKWR